jgi:hypothetical protein
MSQYHFDYSLSNLEFFEDENALMENYNNQIMEDSISYAVSCNFCNGFGHTIKYCKNACLLGHNLHLKGIEVRHFDIEMECSGNSIKAWVESLTIMQIIVISNKINLIAYTNSLWERGMINEDTSFLNIREDYNIALRFFYYYEPTGENFPIKYDFKIGIIYNIIEYNTFECPICLEENVEIKEMIILNCTHKVCKQCFNKYLKHNHFNKENKPLCSLCRCIIKNADYVEKK